MNSNVQSVLAAAALGAGAAVLTCGSPAAAAIVGFGDFSGFTVNQGDTNAAPSVSPGSIRLTGTGSVENRSIFSNAPQDVTRFTASFTYRAEVARALFNGGGGAAFVVQSGPAGAAALGSGTVGSQGVARSGALTLELYASSSASGYYANGAALGGSASTSPVSLTSGHPINVTLTYDGSILRTTMIDAVTQDRYTNAVLANIPAAAGPTAYVGFTAANTGNQAAAQTFSDFSYAGGAVPEPGSAAALVAGGAGLLARRRRRHPG